MCAIEEIKCMSDEEVENEESLEEEEDDWEGCEDVLMDDEFYEREYCD